MLRRFVRLPLLEGETHYRMVIIPVVPPLLMVFNTYEVALQRFRVESQSDQRVEFWGSYRADR